MPFIMDWKLNPFSFIDKIFDEHPNTWQECVSTFFREKLSDESEIAKIPWLNEVSTDGLIPNQIVKFRGMIQDMFDTEFYLDTYQVKNAAGQKFLKPGRYRDIAHVSAKEEVVTDSPQCITGDRRTYYCISIPGENEWVKEIHKLEDGSREAAMPSGGLESGTKKRLLTDDESNPKEVEAFSNDQMGEAAPSSNEILSTKENLKRLKDEAPAAEAKKEEGSSLHEKLNFPFPEMEGKASLVKIYDESEFRLNDIIEVVGILSMDPSLGFLPDTEMEGNSFEFFMATFNEKEISSHSPPSSLVPRIHALTIKKMDHCNPFVKCPLTPGDIPQISDMREMRETLRSILEVALLGDALAAEYMLMHLVSSVYLRQDVLALGKFSMNISGINPDLQKQEYPSQLYHFLQSIVTHSHLLPLTLDNMNKYNFIPRKDYDSNRLKSGVLQLPPHLHLVLDETQLSAGQLDVSGVKNLTALGNLVSWQKVDYDFHFHNLEQHTDVPVLILSEGKAMINSDCQVKLAPTSVDVALAFSRVASLLTPEVIRQIRIYLTTCRLSTYALPDVMRKKVEDDFVLSRQQENGMTADDLHNLLVLARLVSLTCGEHELTADVWKCAKILESERKTRNKQI